MMTTAHEEVQDETMKDGSSGNIDMDDADEDADVDVEIGSSGAPVVTLEAAAAGAPSSSTMMLASPPPPRPPSTTAPPAVAAVRVPTQQQQQYAKTPPRSSLANQHTPIASIKRPRSSMEAANGSRRGGGGASNNGQRGGDDRNSNDLTLSPLHPPKAVHRSSHHVPVRQQRLRPPDVVADAAAAAAEDEEDELFSPVLKLEPSASTGVHVGEARQQPPRVVVGDAGADHDDVAEEEEEEDQRSECSMSVNEPDHADDDDFNPWQFIKSLPPYSYVKHLTPPVALPPKLERPGATKNGTNNGADDKKEPHPYETDLTLVLDLDETLVHCTVEPTEDFDFRFGVTFHGMEYQVYVRLRPNLYKFLELIENRYEVVVFTASQKVYADELLNRIDPGTYKCTSVFAFLCVAVLNRSFVSLQSAYSVRAHILLFSLFIRTENKYFHHRLFRESCLAVEGNFLKDLNVLGRDMAKTVLVDNSPHAFGYQLDNGIPIESWFDDESDRELLKLERFLRQIAGSPDVREDCRRKFRCRDRVLNAPEYPPPASQATATSEASSAEDEGNSSKAATATTAESN